MCITNILVRGFFVAVFVVMVLPFVSGAVVAKPKDIPRWENNTKIWVLIEALWDLDYDVRQEAALTLGERGDQRAIAPLIRALEDEFPEVREAAAEALKRLGEPLGLLIQDSLKGSQRAREDLAKRKDPRATDILIKLTMSWDSNLRKAATAALREISDPRTYDFFVKKLADKNPDVRQLATVVLGDLGDRRAIDPLIKALGDERPDMREAAADALEKLGEPLGRLIERMLNGSWEAMEELIMRKDPRVIDILIKAEKNRVPRVREAAAVTLGRMGDRRAIAPLIKTLENKASIWREGAISALGEIGDKRAVDPLIKALSDKNPKIHQAAAWALRKLGKPVDLLKRGNMKNSQ